MRNVLFCIGLVVLCAWAGAAERSAGHAMDPPVKSAVLEAALHPMPQEQVEEYLESVGQVVAFDTYAGQAEALKAAESGDRTMLVAAGFEVGYESADLFGDGFQDGAYTVYESAVVSVEASAIRLNVDLSELADDEEVWVIDPTGPRAFGPYTRADAGDEGHWLAVIEGDTAVLAARSLSGAVPQVRLVAVSHFYQGFQNVLKELSCNINIACESNATIQSLSTGVGFIVVPKTGYYQAVCTGTLINNEDTAEFEPYLLTSWHCIPDAVSADEVEVIWDYRATACGTDDPPALSSLPRSSGEVLLTTNSNYDATLMRLYSVPSGTSGRAYVGWTTSTPTVGESVIGMHYPQGAHLRISYGTVQAINQASYGFTKQTKVHWYDGVTEGGSSGNGLLLVDEGYLISGTLSNGPTHSCVDTSGNVDWYSSFRDFYDQAAGWLTGTDPPDPEGDTGSDACAASKTFEDNPEVLDALRAFRDQGLATSDTGRRLVKAYYQAAPTLVDLVEQSPDARNAFAAIAGPFATLGAWLEGRAEPEPGASGGE